MSRKPRRGYYVKGQFVAEGSELDLQLKAELKGTDSASKSDLKRESAAVQALGEALLELRGERLTRLELPDKLRDALDEARRITNFEGRRRQMQFIGKLMRQLPPETLDAARAALAEQHQGSADETQVLHLAERWRTELLAGDDAVLRWMQAFPATDSQQLRALIRQARKDHPADRSAESQGLAPRHGKAYREIFQLVRQQLHQGRNAPAEAPSEDPND